MLIILSPLPHNYTSPKLTHTRPHSAFTEDTVINLNDMAPTSAANSSIALAGMTESVKIPKPRDDFWAGKDSFAAVAARSLPTRKPTGGLPTPPNSISPSLPPQAYKGRASTGPLTPPAPVQIDSDIDLEDAVEHAQAQDSPQRGLTARGLSNLADLDSVGVITPGLLAKHHLPSILLDNGPLAIRHVMGYLTTTVPGFSGLPPAKARRLVVGALEGRGSDGQQGGIDGDVIFEKVGWGRWDARRRGQPTREARDSQHHHIPQGSLRIPLTSTRQDRTQLATSHDSRQYHTPTEDMLEDDADKMSLDEMDTCDSDDLPNDKHTLEDLDMTDEEDWSSMGAAALRQGSSLPPSGLIPTYQYYPSHLNPRPIRGRGADGRPPTTAAKSMPITDSVMYNMKGQQQAAAHALMGFSPLPENGYGGDAQDREAVEALLKLSSV